MLKDDLRAAAVVKTVADMANRGQKRQGRALGIAYSDARWGAANSILR